MHEQKAHGLGGVDRCGQLNALFVTLIRLFQTIRSTLKPIFRWFRQIHCAYESLSYFEIWWFRGDRWQTDKTDCFTSCAWTWGNNLLGGSLWLIHKLLHILLLPYGPRYRLFSCKVQQRAITSRLLNFATTEHSMLNIPASGCDDYGMQTCGSNIDLCRQYYSTQQCHEIKYTHSCPSLPPSSTYPLHQSLTINFASCPRDSCVSGTPSCFLVTPPPPPGIKTLILFHFLMKVRVSFLRLTSLKEIRVLLSSIHM